MNEGKTLGNQLLILSGFPFPSTDFTSERIGEPLIRIRDLQQQNPETYFSGDYDSSFLVTRGDVLVGMDGDFNAVKWQGPQALLNQRVCKITTKDPAVLNQDFLYHSLQPHLNNIHKGTAQTTVKHLSTKDLYGIDAELPPLPEQKKIAEILSGIDRQVGLVSRAIDSGRAARNSLMESIFQDGHSKATNGSSEWRIWTIEKLLAYSTTPMRSGPFGSALLKEELADEGIPFLGIDNVKSEEFVPTFKRFLPPEKFQQLRRYEVFPRDVMITIMGTVGRSCVVPEGIGPCVSSKHTWTMTFDKHKVAPEIVCWQLNHFSRTRKSFLEGSQGGVMDAISSQTLRETEVPVPIAGEFAEKILGYYKMSLGHEQAMRAKLEKTKSLKNAVSADLLSGRKRVSV